jgi:phosphoribosylglycinamide formyltransferase-1
MPKPNLLVFASGSRDGGGSGFENLVLRSREGILGANIVAVVSNYENGGVRERADRLGIRFIHFPKPQDAEGYRRIVINAGADFVALSGWLKLVCGLDPRTTINIHPGPLPEFGGPGLYGHYVHEAVIAAFRQGEITHSAVSMHFVTPKYDEGPVFFKRRVKILDDDTSDSIAKRVNECEHRWQPIITNLVVRGEIRWDGQNPSSLEYPPDYSIEQFE